MAIGLFRSSLGQPPRWPRCPSTTEEELGVLSTEYTRTGFQGVLNLYRIFDAAGDLNAFSDRTIDVPALYIGGASEWGPYQAPGVLEHMNDVCTKLLGVKFVRGAGHSVPEEQPEAVNQLLSSFLRQARVL